MQNQVALKGSISHKLMFFVPSLLGLLLFMTPIIHDGNPTIWVAVFAKGLGELLGSSGTFLAAVIIILMGVFSALCFICKPKVVLHNPFLKSLMLPSVPWLITRFVGSIFAAMTYFKIGPAYIWSPYTGELLLSLSVDLLCIFVFAGALLPLLLNFGLLEFVGVKCASMMQRLFNLPGGSAVGCLASWFGDGSLGVMITNSQYEEKKYTQREAAVIGTSFSAVSITFTLVILSQVQLEHMFAVFYATVCLTGLLCAIIVPRLPPLSWKKDIYIDGSAKAPQQHQVDTSWSTALDAAMAHVEKLEPWTEQVKAAAKNVIDMVCGVLPVVMAIGTLATIVAHNHYLPILEWVGKPFVPYLELLGIPEATAASKTIMVGFADMFLPSILATPITSEMTRFIIAALSVTQLIYLSEIGALLLGSKIPLNLFELWVIFILRTLVSLPIISAMAHLLF